MWEERDFVDAVSESRVSHAYRVSERSKRIVSSAAFGCQRHAGWPKRNTFGKEKGGKKTKLVQKAAFPSLPSPYVQRDAGPKHVAARKLAHFVQKAYSAFAYGTKGSAVLRQQC